MGTYLWQSSEVGDTDAACHSRFPCRSILLNVAKTCRLSQGCAVWDLGEKRALPKAEIPYQLLVDVIVASLCKGDVLCRRGIIVPGNLVKVVDHPIDMTTDLHPRHTQPGVHGHRYAERS